MREGQRGSRPEDIKASHKAALDASFIAANQGPEDGIIDLTEEDMILNEKRISTGKEVVLDTSGGDLEIDDNAADEIEAKRTGKRVETVRAARMQREDEKRIKELRKKLN